MTELLCDVPCSNGHSGRDLEKGAPNLADRTLAFKKPGEVFVNIPGARSVPGGLDVGERSPLLAKSRSTGRLEENGGTPTLKSPSLSRYNRYAFALWMYTSGRIELLIRTRSSPGKRVGVWVGPGAGRVLLMV